MHPTLLKLPKQSTQKLSGARSLYALLLHICCCVHKLDTHKTHTRTSSKTKRIGFLWGRKRQQYKRGVRSAAQAPIPAHHIIDSSNPLGVAEGIAACLAIACHVVYWLDRLPLGAAPPPSFPPSCLPPPLPVLLFFDCWDFAVGEGRFEVGCATARTCTVRARLVQVAEAALRSGFGV